MCVCVRARACVRVCVCVCVCVCVFHDVYHVGECGTGCVCMGRGVLSKKCDCDGFVVVVVVLKSNYCISLPFM